MSGHKPNIGQAKEPRVAFDVASHAVRFANQSRGADVRSSKWIEVPELPWPLRFDFVNAVNTDDGTESWICVGFEVGRPIAADSGADIAGLELTLPRLSTILENFHRYVRIAELRLTRGDEGYQEAARIRGTMGRVLDVNDPVALALFKDEYETRKRAGEHRLQSNMCAEYNISRWTLSRYLERAKAT
jgi:hypothetical protein